jgi:hypothetical protein
MFFPLFRGKQFELLALRELANRIVPHGQILPIIEPVKTNATTRLSLDRFTESNLRFVLITNPRVGNLNSDRVFNGLIQPSLSEYDNFLPALYVDQRIARANIERFLGLFPNLQHALIYIGEPNQNDVITLVASLASVNWHIFINNRTSEGFRGRFPADKRVVINDCFNRQDRNADYPEDEFFTDRHLGAHSHAFGNYSIVGDDYSDTGGPAYAVALHHVYFRDGLGSALHVRHFVSERTETPVDPGGKFLEALQKLVTAIPTLGDVNMTPTCTEYMDLFARQEFPGLGCAKKLAIKHHLELLLKTA